MSSAEERAAFNAQQVARSARRQPRPKSVGWNPFNSTSAGRSRVRRRDPPKPHQQAVAALPPRANSVAAGASTLSALGANAGPFVPGGGTTAGLHANDSGRAQTSVGRSRPLAASDSSPHHLSGSLSAPILSALELSRMPDDDVWANLSNMSLRDLAAGHHCAPMPVKRVHPLLEKRLRTQNRLESMDKHQRMMLHLQHREASRWRLANRKRERIAVQEYCSQPVLHIPDEDITLNVSDPMSIGQVLREKYKKTHPEPSYNVKVYRRLKKRADLRALDMILTRFNRSEQHEERVSTIKDYTRGLSRGSLRVSAMKRSELETRLGTPFALSGRSIYAKPGTATGFGGGSGQRRGGARRGRGRGSTAPAGGHEFGPGAFDIPAGVAKPSGGTAGGGLISASASEALGFSPAPLSKRQIPGTAPAKQSRRHRPETGTHQRQQQQPVPRLLDDGHGSGFGPKPIWERVPHANWKPPSHYLNSLQREATKKSKTRQRGGFPNKYIYPTEVSGLDTLFPD